MLAACSSDEKSDDRPGDTKESTAEVSKTTLICPQVAIVRDLGDIHDYGTEDADASQLVAEARMNAVDGDCAYGKDGIDVRFSISFISARGPRLGGQRTSFPYFIAVIDPEDTILNKDRMTEDFHFSSNDKVSEKSEDIHVFVPISKEKLSLGPAYRILVGFQLTQQQLNAARNH